MNQPGSILEAIRLHAANTPDKLCIGDKTRCYTYGEFWTLICEAAAFLRKQGVRRGDNVVIRGTQKTEFALAVFAVQLAGGVSAPLEKSIRDERICEIMEFLNARFFIAEKALKKEGYCYIRMKDLLDPESTEPAEELPLPEAEDLADILFTTGTTGKSKGIEVTVQGNAAIAQNVNDSVEMTPDEVELITTPLNHALGIRRIYGAMYIGSSVIVTEGVKFVNSFFDLMDRYQVTAITFVPAILEQLLLNGKEQFAGYDAQLHYIQLGSAPLSETNKQILLEMFPSVRLYNTYGASESACSIILEFSKYQDRENCIGRSTVNTTVLFVDDDRNEVKATAQAPGLFAFRGGMNMHGYYKEPEITATVLDENGIVYTNDMGYQGEDGLYYLLGRRGDVINMGGIKVAPTEVEEVAMLHPMVKDCACIPVRDEITGEAIKMFLSLNEGFSFDQKELSVFLLNKLEALKVPKEYEVIEEIPRTFNGKIIRRELKEREAASNT